MSQSDEDIGKEISDWGLQEDERLRNEEGEALSHGRATGADGKEAGADEKNAAADEEKQKEVIDVDADAEDGTKKKEMTARSKIWDHFIKIMEKGVVVKGQCKYCKAEIKAHPVHNGTSGMRKHFGVCKSNPHRSSDDATQGVLQVSEGNNVGTWKFDPELLRSAFTEMIIEDEEPFGFGEKPGFRKFMSIACPRFIIPSRRTCTRDTMQLYFEQKAKLKMFFQEHCNRVCLTTDGWTSQQQDSYMTATAHFIDNDWCLHKKIISFFKVKGKKGDDIGKHLHKVLLDWGLDKVMTVTVDNASANDSGVSYLRRQMNSLKTSIADGKYLHMRCAAHIVNLIVQDGLKEVDQSIKRIRAAIRFVRASSSRIAKFKEIAQWEKVDSKPFLNLDVCTRWNSTYDMLAAACTYEKVFARYPEEDPYYTIELLSETKPGVPGPGVPDEHDWDNARKLAEFLKYFANITTRVSASLSVTAHTYFHEILEVNALVNEWLTSADFVQQDMGKRMKDKYDKYWGQWHDNLGLQNEKGKGKEKEKENINLLIFVAVVLDPRYKLSQYTEIAIEDMYGEGVGQKVWAAITKCLHDLFEEYRAKNSSPSPVNSQPSDETQSKQGRDSPRKARSNIVKRMKLNSGVGSCSRGGIRTELDRYLAEECEEDTKKFDILAWWKGQATRFPILSKLARDVLAIQISTVASESAFSTGGRVLDDFRTSLTPFMVEALVCTQDWLRRATPINLSEDTEQLTKLEEGDNS